MMPKTLVFLLLIGMANALSAGPPLINSVEVPHSPSGQYDRLELKAEVSTKVKNPYDYDSIVFGGQFIGPDFDTLVVDGFYYQPFTVNNGQLLPTGNPHFRLRFTPSVAGVYSYRLYVTDQEGTSYTDWQTFVVSTSDKAGFLRFAPAGKYLQNARGEAVFLVGENIAWANTPSGGDTMTYYLQKLHQHGMNYAKLMMTPWGYQIEWNETGWRNYGGRQRQAFLLDSIFGLAGHLGIYCQLAFSIHNELNFGYPAEDWTSNPYNLANGGCCLNAWEFFSHPEALSAFRNRLRYIVARWGYSTSIFGWELLSEADNFPWYGAHQQTIAAWGHAMAAYLRSVDTYPRAVSVGFALAANNFQIWTSDNIGFTQLHHYKKAADIEGEVAALHASYLKRFGKPVLTGEFGLGHVGDSLVVWDPTGLALHNSLWVSATTGSFAGVVPWFWENYINAQNLYHVFTPLATFMHAQANELEQLTPMHLSTQATAYADWMVTPRFNQLQRSPSTHFVLHHTGLMLPTQDSLPVMLPRPNPVLAGLRNPPVFHGDWSQPGIMRINVGVQATNALLQVKVDGQLMLEQLVQPNSSYLLPIPTGMHQLMLDNKGAGFFSILEISSIVFEHYAPELRAFALVGQAKALAWVHNRHSH